MTDLTDEEIDRIAAKVAEKLRPYLQPAPPTTPYVPYPWNPMPMPWWSPVALP